MGILARLMGRESTVNLQQPDYGTARDLPTETAPDGVDMAPELPITTDALAGGMPVWEDALLDLDIDAYKKMRTCHAVVKPIRKLAIRTAKLNWTVVGEGKRAEQVAEIFGQIEGWSDFIEWMTWALVEGVRFYQIKKAKPAMGSEGKALWVVPDFFMGGRLKANAGGSIRWDGRLEGDTLVQQAITTGQHKQDEKTLPIDEFAIHRPGGGSNPEGDLWLGVTLYNAVALPATRGITSGDLWMRLFAIPAILAGAKVKSARVDQLQARFNAFSKQIQKAMGTGATTALSNEDLVKLLQADPNGLKGITEWLRYLESIADDMLTFGVLTSSSGIADASRTGNTQAHRDDNDEAAFANGVQIAETFNRFVLPWILRENEDLEPLGDDEAEVYLWPNDPNETDEQDVEVEGEGTEGNIDADGGDMLGGDIEPDEDSPAANLQKLYESMQAKGGKAQVALAKNVSPVPPVH